MRTIIKGDSNILQVLGTQRLKNVRYRMMKYVLRAECEDGVLLHNSITGQLILLDKKEEECLERIPCLIWDELLELAQNRFLVPEDYNEKETVREIRALLTRLYGREDVEGYTILTTTNCNARCFYCYESNLPHVNMDEDTAVSLVDYMAEHKGRKSLKLHWFGGEPLVCADRIDQICKELVNRGIDFHSTMTSNGFLFTESMVKRAVSLWNLDSVQITLDGTEDVYNKTKAYVNICDSPFKMVLENIRLILANEIRVIIRLNLDKHNMNDLEKLIVELSDSIDQKDKLEVYSHVLFENAGFSPIERDGVSKSLLYAKNAELNDRLHKVGLSKAHPKLPTLKTHNCMADTENSIVVYPDGRLFKCEHIEIGDEVGHITKGITQSEGLEKFKLKTELKECSSCQLYPSCILLMNCQGTADKDRQICEFDITDALNSIKDAFRHYKLTS